jgi:hypothetical protein
MDAVSSYSLLQEFHSRPPPVPFSLITSSVHNTVYPDANTTLLNLASKTAQSRRRRQGPASSSRSLQSQGQYALLSSDQAKVQRVYSEVMMSTNSTYQPTITIKGSSPTSSSFKRIPSLQRRVIRQRPISPEGSIASASSSISPSCRREQIPRGRVLGQALLKPKEVRQIRKPVDLSLVQQKSPHAAAAVHGPDDDGDDEDWAEFIGSGYGNFPQPPAHISPASTIMSGSTFLSPSTCATSLPSSDLTKTQDNWMDDELAWASSDDEDSVVVASKSDEEQEIVRSPFPTETARHSNASSIKSRASSFTSNRPSSISTVSTANTSIYSSPGSERGYRKASHSANDSSSLSDKGCGSQVPSIAVSYESEDDYQSLPAKANLHSRTPSKLLRLLGDEQCRPRPRQASQASSLASSQLAGLTRSSLAYLSPDAAITTNPSKGQSTALKLRNRLASKMNMCASRRTSTPDVPVTPRSATSDTNPSLSPSCEIFGTAAVQSAAINARASAYATMAASMISPKYDSQHDSASSQFDQYAAAIPKAGLCFDYDPKSPLFLEQDSGPVSPAVTRTLPSATFLRRATSFRAKK